jgi:hypothetical protein
LNFELTQTLSHQFHGVKYYELSVYIIFVLATTLLAFLVLPTIIIVGIFFGFSVVIFVLIGMMKATESTLWPGNWSVDRVECKRGDIIKITCTTFDEEIPLEKGRVVWEIKDQCQHKSIHREEAKSTVTIKKFDSYIWVWDTSNVKSGLYRLFPRVCSNDKDKEDRSLRRTIRVLP